MKREGQLPINEILIGDALSRLRELPDECVNCAVTSPPYWGLRDYGVEGQLGLEATPEEFVCGMVTVFREVRRVLRSDGTLWLNIGDSYAGSGRGRNADGTHGSKGGDKQKTNVGSTSGTLKRRICTPGLASIGESQAQSLRADEAGRFTPNLKSKDLVGIPWRLAFALQADGWWLRQDIIWSKPNPMPESVSDRCTKAHEYLFLLAKSESYEFNQNSIREPFASGDALKWVDGLALGSEPHTAISHAVPKSHRGGKFTNGKKAITARNVGQGPRMDHDGRNKRSVWTIQTEAYPEAHFATFPQKLVEPCVLAGSPQGGVVLDPFMGSGTTALVALKARRNFIGVELNPKYAVMAVRRIQPELSQGRLA